MALKIMPHGRLQEWVAEEQGYSSDELKPSFQGPTQHWTEAHHLFPEQPETLLGYDEAALV